ncbi:MAG: MFS transporter [Bacteroidales bacterium]|nr:MFS transporter [Bacteroidales bacterium]
MSAGKIRAIYLLLYMGFAVWRVYYNVFLEDIGFTGAQIGTLNALLLSTIFIVVPLWGYIADKKGIRPTLKWLAWCTALLIFILGYIDTFWALLFFIPLLSVFYHPLGPLTDALAIQFAQNDKKHSFGSFRLWGSLGWALASVIGGMVFKRIAISYIFGVSALFFLTLSPLLITHKRKKIYRPHFESFKISGLLSNKPLFVFILILTFYGIVCSPVNSYLNLYFKELKAGNNIIGYAYAIMAFSELPFFILGNRLLKTLGARSVISIAMIVMVIRLMLYGFAPGIAVSLATGALQGISLSFFLVGAVDYLHKLTPAGRHATSQSIIWTCYSGIGQMLGNLFIGPIMDKLGMVSVMKIFTVAALFCFILTGLYFQMAKKQIISSKV